MLSQVNKNLLYGLLVLVLLNTYVFKNEVINSLIGIIALGIIIYSNRKALKTLSFLEIIGVLAFIAAVIALLTVFFYFIANPLIQLITVRWLNFVVKVVLVIGVFIPALGLLYKGMRMITNDKFPVMDMQSNKEDDQNYPNDDEIKQLINQGKTVEATKRARERYGYSLLKAHDYIQQFKK